MCIHVLKTFNVLKESSELLIYILMEQHERIHVGKHVNSQIYI